MPSKPPKKAPSKKTPVKASKKEEKAAKSFADTIPVEVVEAITLSVVPSVSDPDPAPAASPTHIPAPGLPAVPPTVKPR